MRLASRPPQRMSSRPALPVDIRGRSLGSTSCDASDLLLIAPPDARSERDEVPPSGTLDGGPAQAGPSRERARQVPGSISTSPRGAPSGSLLLPAPDLRPDRHVLRRPRLSQRLGQPCKLAQQRARLPGIDDLL